MNINKHIEQWKGCTKCEIGDRANKHVFFRGTLPCDVLFIGEGPGKSENKSGKPFVGRAGLLLTEWIVKCCGDLTRAITNVVCCRPCDTLHGPNRPPNAVEINACTPRLLDFVKIAKPKRVVYLGYIAYIWCKDLGLEVPTQRLYHPAYCLRKGGSRSLESKNTIKLLREFLEDLK